MKQRYMKIAFGMALMIIATSFLLTGAAAIPGSNAIIETVVISEGNTAPVAENIELRTFRGIAISGVLKATDPEGEQTIFEIVSQPKRGTLNIGENGAFVYDPGDTKKGSDCFTYCAIDKSGNRSETATVSIKILKQKEAIVYEDMEGSEANYAALALNEKGVMTGESIAGSYFFHPEDTLTQGEFLAMCIKASGRELLSGVVRTGLENDSEIPTWAKQYVSTAVLSGCYSGDSSFQCAEEITYEAAAVMLDSAFSLTDVVSVMSISPYLRTGSYQAVMNLYACKIADEALISNYDLPLTRKDAALLLCRAMETIEDR